MQDELIKRACELLEDGTVDRVLGWSSGDFFYDITPTVFTSADEVRKRFVYNDFCGANLSKYLIAESQKDGKIAAFLKPCDTYSFNQLLTEHRINREKVYVIGIPCDGKVSVGTLNDAGIDGILSTERDGGDLVCTTVYGEKRIPFAEAQDERCINCKSRKHVVYDELIGEEGEVLDSHRFDEVEKLGCEAMLYSNQFMLSSYLLPQQIDRLWLANHVEETSYAGSYEFWQCSHTGRIPGISYAVDLDFWFDPGTGRRPVMTFSDVASGYWAYDDLSLAVALGWVSGYPDNTFRPTATLTRADFVTLLARLSGEDLSGCTGSMFPDVTPGKYYAPSVVWAVRVGIVSGFPDGTFRPNENVTRQQMAHIMRLYLRHKGTDVSRIAPEIERQIADLDMIGKWALDDVLFCYGENLLQGRSGSFVPAGTATRAEAAVVLTRLFRYENGEDPIPVPVEPIETPPSP